MGQLLLPGMPLRRTRVRIRKVSPAVRVVNLYCTLRGPVVYGRPVMLKQVKDMVEAGYLHDEIAGCIKWLHEDDGVHGLNWSLAYVARRMPDYRRRDAGIAGVSGLVEVPDDWQR